MARRSKPIPPKSGFTLGREAFAKISAVEGIVSTPEMDEMFRRFDRDGLSPDECRREIIRIYGGSRQR
jgi:hypothetical protein